MHIMDVIKSFFAALIGSLLAYLEPVHNSMLILLFLSACDFFVGVITSIIYQTERFRFSKFITAVAYLLVYFLTIAGIYTVGEYQGDASEALFVVKTITYAFVYFYVANVFKNFNRLFPYNQAIRFLDYLLNFEFVAKIPYLKGFIDQDKRREETQENEQNNNAS